jgi:hypothetical protein
MTRLRLFPVLLCSVLFTGATALAAPRVELLQRGADPYGLPRPVSGAQYAPLETSFYVQMQVQDSPGDVVDLNSITLTLTPAGGSPQPVLQLNQQWGPGFTGVVSHIINFFYGNLGSYVYVTPLQPLAPSSTYMLQVTASSLAGAPLAGMSSWSFSTESAPGIVPVNFTLDLAAPPVSWTGAFFSGFCKPSFSTSYIWGIEGYDLMAPVYHRYPKAFGVQRDFWLTGGQLSDPPDWFQIQPQIMREQETRHITSIEDISGAAVLTLEDFFGHQQYGIVSDRPLSADYHAGDVVLVADDQQSSQATVQAVNDANHTVQVSPLAYPAGTWLLDYDEPLPTEEDPRKPGLFPTGGCYLRKFNPVGTPKYFWGRLDTEWDLAVFTYGRRMHVNFCDAPGDTALDGRSWTTAKDYAQLHDVIYDISDHVIKRYGAATTSWLWSVFNEPDLINFFWRSDWNELQKFYDYTGDALLRAFEDNGYDSGQVRVGGLELAAIFGTQGLRLHDFLAHCSPTATHPPGELELNAAYADPRLAGRRSLRVEQLCAANGGKGSPCDFISIHTYNKSQIAADKLTTARSIALSIDPVYFANLSVNTHESCPDWAPPPDPAIWDSYSGNGYFPAWTMDVVGRLLRQGALDPRYTISESIMTLWPWPDANLQGAIQAFWCDVGEDSNGDGQPDRTVALKKSIFNAITLLASMGDDYYVLPQFSLEGHVVSGFATCSEDDVRIMLYDHNWQDSQATSGKDFRVRLAITGLPDRRFQVRQYRIDRDYNTYFRLRELFGMKSAYTRSEVRRLIAATQLHETARRQTKRASAGSLSLDLDLHGNGLNFVVLEGQRWYWPHGH